MANSNDLHRLAHERLREKQDRFNLERELRLKVVLDEIPRLQQIKEELASNMREFTRFAFSGDRSEEKFNEYKNRSLALQKERKELLLKHGYAENLFEESYYCDLCKDQGYKDNQFCECFKRELSEVFLENSNLMKIYNDQVFEKYELDFFLEEDGSKGKSWMMMKKLTDYLKLYAESFRESSNNLLFIGAPGCGKSFLSCAVACEVVKNGVFVFYTPVQDMVSQFETEHFGNNKNVDTSVYKDCDLLIIDDLGTEFKTQFTDSVLYNVINDRINMKKPMIISTNYTLEELKETYHDRLCSRLINEFLTIKFENRDIRQLKKIKKSQKNRGNQ
ncbi:MAG: ATP-binding protein [Clostridia bacterium]|nr:ATP-binding protein [Clostridia bacterium]